MREINCQPSTITFNRLSIDPKIRTTGTLGGYLDRFPKRISVSGITAVFFGGSATTFHTVLKKKKCSQLCHISYLVVDNCSGHISNVYFFRTFTPTLLRTQLPLMYTFFPQFSSDIVDLEFVTPEDLNYSSHLLFFGEKKVWCTFFNKYELFSFSC